MIVVAKCFLPKLASIIWRSYNLFCVDCMVVFSSKYLMIARKRYVYMDIKKLCDYYTIFLGTSGLHFCFTSFGTMALFT